MVAHIRTVAFQGIKPIDIDAQVQLSNGLPAFTIVGLPDKAVAESRERVRAALSAIGLALPPKRITVNLSPADIQKEGSHFDLPIALGILVAMECLPMEELDGYLVLGELGLDGGLATVSGVLPTAVSANGQDKGLICPLANGAEAAWAGSDFEIIAAPSLIAIINHFKGTQILSRPDAMITNQKDDQIIDFKDFKDIKGQEVAKRALEIAAVGGHNLLMCGPPGAGKSMLAARLPGILPKMDAMEALEISMIQSVSGGMKNGIISANRPFRDPHHSTSVPALVGGGQKAKPGEISLAHNGVLFLDELPEFQRGALEALRQPLESGRAVIARANAHVTYPARVQLIAAMNPCRCGHLDDAEIACSRAPKCAVDYQAKISGPLFDRIDLHVDVAALSPMDLTMPPPSDDSATIAARVEQARNIQLDRFSKLSNGKDIRTNAQADGKLLEEIASPDNAGRDLLMQATDKLKLSARGYHRVLRVARSLADMAGSSDVKKPHIAEALSYRRIIPGR